MPSTVDAIDLNAEVDFAARPDPVGDVFPQLTRAELGIEELLDQRGFGLLLGDVVRLAQKCLLEKVRNAPCERQSLDALRPHSALILSHGTPQTFSV